MFESTWIYQCLIHPIHSNSWFIQKWASLMNDHWISGSLIFFFFFFIKTVDSSVVKHLFVSFWDTQQFCCDFFLAIFIVRAKTDTTDNNVSNTILTSCLLNYWIKSISCLQSCRFSGEKKAPLFMWYCWIISYDINIRQKPIQGLFFALISWILGANDYILIGYITQSVIVLHSVWQQLH